MKHFDLIVAGGGFAGAASAITAARKGLSVLLVERYNALGGAAVHALVMPFMRYWDKRQKDKTPDSTKGYFCGSVFLEVIREMQKITGEENDTRFDEEVMKLVLNRMAVSAGVTLLYNSVLTEAITDSGKISAVKVYTKGGMLTFTADYFIDATGDGELSALAGCDFQLGREGDNLCQPMTLSFRLSGIDKEQYTIDKPGINPLYEEWKKAGKIKNPRENVLIFLNYNQGVLHFNTTRIVKKSPIDGFEVTQAEIEAREQVFETLHFLKSNFKAFENARVLSTAIQIGIRESRKITGEYVLTNEDCLSLARFEDAVAVSNYDIDIHNPEGSGTSHHYFAEGEWFQIPYRCLIPKGMKNLLVAGRCISASHEAQASLRIMPYCSQLGQAAGNAVYVAKTGGVGTSEISVPALQEILRKEDFVI